MQTLAENETFHTLACLSTILTNPTGSMHPIHARRGGSLSQLQPPHAFPPLWLTQQQTFSGRRQSRPNDSTVKQMRHVLETQFHKVFFKFWCEMVQHAVTWSILASNMRCTSADYETVHWSHDRTCYLCRQKHRETKSKWLSNTYSRLDK